MPHSRRPAASGLYMAYAGITYWRLRTREGRRSGEISPRPCGTGSPKCQRTELGSNTQSKHRTVRPIQCHPEEAN